MESKISSVSDLCLKSRSIVICTFSIFKCLCLNIRAHIDHWEKQDDTYFADFAVPESLAASSALEPFVAPPSPRI